MGGCEKESSMHFEIKNTIENLKHNRQDKLDQTQTGGQFGELKGSLDELP